MITIGDKKKDGNTMSYHTLSQHAIPTYHITDRTSQTNLINWCKPSHLSQKQKQQKRATKRSSKNDPMFISNNRGLRFLLGIRFFLLLQPFTPTATATDDEHEYDKLGSRELATGGGGSPPWATGSICTPDGPFYNPVAVDQCKECCQERKCHNRCLNQCKSNAANTAQNRKDYCRSYDGDDKDGPPSWGTCGDKLGQYKESHCQDYDGCVTKYEAKHVANDAWYHCDELEPPRHDCAAFGDCVYENLKQTALLKSKSALADCKAGVYKSYTEGKCDSIVPCLKDRRRLAKEAWEGACPKKQTCADCDGCCDYYGAPAGCKDLCCQCPGRCPTPPPDDCTDQQCIDYSKCVYNFYEAEAQKKQYDAEKSCRPDKFVGGKCDYEIPAWHPSCGNWRDDWYDACKANDCDDILKDLQYAHSKSGTKGRHAICDDFWDCVYDYERHNDNSYSRDQGNEAKRDCRQCENNGRDCKDEVGDDHEKGKDDECLSYLGGWDRSCNSYYDCWNSRLKGECDDCASNGNGAGCFAKYDSCKKSCMSDSLMSDCQAECDVCFCESDPDFAIEKCEAIGDDCCNDPYGWLNDSNMRSLEYVRGCSSSLDCGTCRGTCRTNADCHNVNLCSKDPRNLKDIYDVPGCKGDPADVKVPFGQDPLDIGYCYNPNKDYPDRTFLVNRCLAQTTTNGYGRCCGLPQFALQCGQTFNNYCDLQPNVPIIQPGTPGTGTGTSTPILEPAKYTGSYCGTSIDQICSSCPSNINDLRECSDCTGDKEGCFSNFACPGCFVQTGVTGAERSGGGGP